MPTMNLKLIWQLWSAVWGVASASEERKASMRIDEVTNYIPDEFGNYCNEEHAIFFYRRGKQLDDYSKYP